MAIETYFKGLANPAGPEPLAQGCVWLRDAVRLARLAASTGRAIHAKALQRHLERIACRVGFQLEELP